MPKAMRQMPKSSGRVGVAHGEAVRDPASDEACDPSHEHQGTGSATQTVGAGPLLEAALTRENLQAAWKRVKANKGAAGVDGLDIEHTRRLLQTSWPQIRQALLAGQYRPQPDLNAGIMDGGVKVDRDRGTPQGGPLSPLLANVLLDEVDKALQARGYCFARYADDCNVYVGSKRAGERVMAWLRTLYGKLKLQINEAKSAVCSAFGRKFLGYALWAAKGREVKCAVAHKALADFKARVRRLTGRLSGRSMGQVVQGLRPYLLGWKAYFGLAQTPRVWRELDEWLRALQLKQWKHGPTMYRELLSMGARTAVAHRVAANSRRWWRNSRKALNGVLTLAWFDQLGLPRLS